MEIQPAIGATHVSRNQLFRGCVTRTCRPIDDAIVWPQLSSGCTKQVGTRPTLRKIGEHRQPMAAGSQIRNLQEITPTEIVLNGNVPLTRKSGSNCRIECRHLSSRWQ